MKANELRIGNILYDSYCGEIIVTDISETGIIQAVNANRGVVKGSFDLNRLHIVLLTEEILFKCGFKHDSNLVNMLCKNGIWFNSKNMEASFLSSKLPKINSLHQLQNLYFALTGEELQVNL